MAKHETSWFKRHKVITVVIIIFVLAAIGAAASGGKDTDSTEAPKQSDQTSAATTTAKPVGLNEPARDGKFEFTVSSLECGKSSVGSNTYLAKTAQGQYCLLTVTVKNIGDQAQSLFSSNQYLLNTAGQKYSADDTATLYNAPNGTSWYNDINPGNSVNGVIVFDVPKDQTPTTAQLHDSAFSSGVKIQL